MFIVILLKKQNKNHKKQIIMVQQKSILFVLDRGLHDLPKIKKLLSDKEFILRPKMIRETTFSRLDLPEIFGKPIDQFSRTSINVLTGYPTKVFLLEKENAVRDLKDFVGPNDTVKAPIGTLSKMFGEYTVACPDSDEQAKKLIKLFYPEINI